MIIDLLGPWDKKQFGYKILRFPEPVWPFFRRSRLPNCSPSFGPFWTGKRANISCTKWKEMEGGKMEGTGRVLWLLHKEMGVFFVHKRENKNFWEIFTVFYKNVRDSPSTKCLPKTPFKPLGRKGFKNFQILLSTKCLPSGSFLYQRAGFSGLFFLKFHFFKGSRGVIFV